MFFVRQMSNRCLHTEIRHLSNGFFNETERQNLELLRVLDTYEEL